MDISKLRDLPIRQKGRTRRVLKYGINQRAITFPFEMKDLLNEGDQIEIVKVDPFEKTIILKYKEVK